MSDLVIPMGDDVDRLQELIDYVNTGDELDEIYAILEREQEDTVTVDSGLQVDEEIKELVRDSSLVSISTSYDAAGAGTEIELELLALP